MRIMTAKIKNLRANVLIGVNESERKSPQPIIINVAIEYDAETAVKTDKIENTLNYCSLADEIVEKAEETSFQLLEKLVDFILDIIMSKSKAISTHVEIDKIAPLKKVADFVSVSGSATKN